MKQFSSYWYFPLTRIKKAIRLLDTRQNNRTIIDSKNFAVIEQFDLDLSMRHQF